MNIKFRFGDLKVRCVTAVEEWVSHVEMQASFTLCLAPRSILPPTPQTPFFFAVQDLVLSTTSEFLPMYFSCSYFGFCIISIILSGVGFGGVYCCHMDSLSVSSINRQASGELLPSTQMRSKYNLSEGFSHPT